MSSPLMGAQFPTVANCVGISTCCIKQKFRLAFSGTPFIVSATSCKNRKNAETIQSDLQGMANNDPVKSQLMKIIEDT